jgi:hypothetical protein
MRPIALFFGPHVPDVQTAQLSVFSLCFKRLERFSKLATSSLASCPLQRGKLQSGVLVIGADARIAVFHALIMRQTYATRKPLIFHIGKIVA